jgi:hypothetical protein
MTTRPDENKSPSSGARDANKQKAASSHEGIAKRAYEIWLAEGQQPGCEQKNWFQAEAQLQRA